MCNTALGGSHCAALLFLKSAANTLNVTNTVGLNGLCFVDKLHPPPQPPNFGPYGVDSSVHCVITAIYTISIKYKFRLMI